METLTKFLSEKNNFDYINSSIDDIQRKNRLAELRQKFESQSNFSSVNFNNSGYVEDNGREDFLNDFSQERAETALIQIRRHLIQEDLKHSKNSLTSYLNARNSVIKHNRERKAELQKEFQKNY